MTGLRAAGSALRAAASLRRRSMVLVLVVVTLGLLGTGLAVAALRRADENRAVQALEEQTHVVAKTVTAEIRRYASTLDDLAAAAGAQARLEASEFAAITAKVDRERFPGATGVSLIIPATTAQIPRLQAYWRARGASGLVLNPAPGTDSHLFVVLLRSLDGATVSIGRDLAPAGAAVEALDLSRRTGRTTVSRAYVFLRDEVLPPEQRQLSIIVATPVYSSSSAAADRDLFRGWMVLGVRGGDFLRESIGVVARNAVAVTLHDTSRAGEQTVLARWEPPDAVVGDIGTRTVAIDAPQRVWQLSVSATNHLLPGPSLHLEALTWLAGGVITVLLAVLTAAVTSSRDRALLRVDEATAALRDDISRRKQVEERLRMREEELVGFAGVIAHDLRGPLARISAYTDFLREEAAPRLDSEHREFLERVRGGTTRMQLLLDDLLDYATADNGSLRISRVDLAAVVADIIAERTGAPAEQVPHIAVGPLPVVDGDPTLLRQVLDNMIGNALKYTGPGQIPHLEITAQERGESWRVEVSDRGIGIPAGERDKIFAAFTRAGTSLGYEGTGLGLAIVQRIVERHGGHVGVDGNEHGGSVFWITLPAVGSTPGARSPAASAV
ncbi:sensor histidine kinase [Winogradskya consettensis]|nr:ATP-binding protein [Actinoplanes consettensis]